MRKITHRAIALATAGAMAVTGLMIQPVAAAPAPTKPAAATQDAANGMTDVSSRKRRHYHRNDRAAIGAMLGIAGTIAGIAAARSYRRHHYYDDGPYAYYGGGPYYGGTYNYAGPRYHRHHHHRHWHR